MPGSGIFISYRRDDSAGFAGRLYDRLAERFGADRVFMDIDTIAPGHEFATDIERALTDCDACVVLIGRDWLTIADADGRRRLDDPTDFVRLEVATAIRRGITVFPVLLNRTTPPSSATLPEEIQPLAGRQAIELTNERWNYDVARLVLALEKEVGPKKPLRQRPGRDPGSSLRSKLPSAIAILAALLVVAGIAAWLAGQSNDTPSVDAGRSTGVSTSATSSSGAPGQSAVPPLDGTYGTTVTLQAMHGDHGGRDLWGNSDPYLGQSWDGGSWVFTPQGSWKVQDWDGFTGRWSKGTYISEGAADCAAGPRADVTRSFEITRPEPAGPPLMAFGGVLTIRWTCDGAVPFVATLQVEGAATG